MFYPDRLFRYFVPALVLFLCLPCLSPAQEKPFVSQNKQEIFVQFGHTDIIDSVAFSQDGKYVLSGGGDTTLRLWEVASGREIRKFMGHTHGVYCVALSPNGKYAVSGSGGDDNAIILWDILTGKQIKQFTEHFDSISAVAFSPDSKYILSASADKSIKLWDISTGKEVKQFMGHTDYVNDAVFSPDGKFILSGSNDIRLWDVATGQEIRQFDKPAKSVLTITFSADGKYALSGEIDGAVTLWDVATGKQIRQFIGHSNHVKSVALSPDGKYALSCSSDNRVDDHTLRLWDVATGKEIKQFMIGQKGWVNCAVFSPDGKTVLAGCFNMIRLWDLTTAKEIRQFTGHSAIIDSVDFSPDNKYILSGSWHGIMRLWDITTGQERRKFNLPLKDFRFVTFSPDGKFILSVTGHGTLSLWDVAIGKEIKQFIGSLNTTFGTALAFSPDGKYISGTETKYPSGTEKSIIKVWEVTTGQEIRQFTGHSSVFSPDSKFILSATKDHIIRLWEVATGQEIKQFSGHSDRVTAVAFSPDGKYILSWSGDNTMRRWDIATGKEVTKFTRDAKDIYSAAFSRDVKYALSHNEDNNNRHVFRFWEVATGKLIKQFNGHPGGIRQFVISPDSKYAVSAGQDYTIRLWHINNGQEIVQMIPFRDGEWICITPDGYYDCSTNGDKHLNVRIGNNVYGIDQYREAFYRPDLVKLALAGGSLKSFKKLADIKQPPIVSIIDLPETIDQEQVKVTLKLVDIGGGIGDVRLYLNGSAIVLDNTRGIDIVSKDKPAVYKSYTIKLTNGLNTLKAVAFNRENTMQSTASIHKIAAGFKARSKPSLHALVVGINEYKNPKLMLKAAVADAGLFADTLAEVTSGLFEQVNIKRLITKEATSRENIIKELKALQSLNPDDLFVFFVASHGTVDDGEYFLITSNVGSTSTAKLKTDALGQNTLKELVANIPTTKKLIVIDTCSAGALGDALQVAMLTRGMSEDTAIKVLSRAVGSTILSASTGLQEAIEGYKGHGLFTYVICEGLRGKADSDQDGFIKTIELANYVDDELPLLAEQVFKKAQYPIVSPSGMGFPIGKVK